jgi:CheY-like chemotaxis protein
MMPNEKDRGVALVLVVDDEPDVLEALRDLLEKSLPAKCVLAHSGAEALEMVERHPIRLILSDYKMPGINGIQFLKQVRHRVPAVPRILMTAFPDLDVVFDAIHEARVEAFLTKPLDLDLMVERVGQALAAPYITYDERESNDVRVECDCCGHVATRAVADGHGVGEATGLSCRNTRCPFCGGPCRGTPFVVSGPARTLTGTAGKKGAAFGDPAPPDPDPRRDGPLP